MILCIGIGNSLRGDDGAAHRVLELIEACDHMSLRHVLQLTPELAAEIGAAQAVIFIDADPRCQKPHLEPIAPRPHRGAPLSHAMTPAELVWLANSLYGFANPAFLCRVPAVSFDGGQQLSPASEAGARSAAELVHRFTPVPLSPGN